MRIFFEREQNESLFEPDLILELVSDRVGQAQLKTHIR